MNVPLSRMNRTQQIDSIISQRQPLADRIALAEKQLTQIQSGLQALRQKRDELLAQATLDESTIAKLRKLDFAGIDGDIEKELRSFAKLQQRFSRPALNIGVIGLARQGKSTLLQSLTGLTTTEIPSGSGEHCTGAPSYIHHQLNTDTYGRVWFHTARSFLDEIIAPYYKALNLGSPPNSLQEFAAASFPCLNSSAGTQVKLLVQGLEAEYNHLRKYHQNLDQYKPLFDLPSPYQISSAQIREYVAQDTAKKERIYFNYLAVQKVEVFCTFPQRDLGKLVLVDMPGLGDTKIGDAERMIHTLEESIDYILLVRRPDSIADCWKKEDVSLYKAANAAFEELPIEKWSCIVLNNTGENFEKCEGLAPLEKREAEGIRVQQLTIANCANPEEAREKVLDPILDSLMSSLRDLDQRYARTCQERVLRLHDRVTEIVDACSTLVSSSENDGVFAFKARFDKFWQGLASDLEQMMAKIEKTRYLGNSHFGEAIQTTIQDCRENPGLPEDDEINALHAVEKDWHAVQGKYMHRVRTNLSKRFLDLDAALKISLEEVKDEVVDVLIDQGLGGLASGRGSEFLQTLTNQIPEDHRQLKLVFQVLADFELLYRGLVQHRIRRNLDALTPDNADAPLSDQPWYALGTKSTVKKQTKAERIRSNLENAHKEAVDLCEKELTQLLKEPNQAGFAIVEEFVDRLLHEEEVKGEFWAFLYKVRFKIWSETFKQMEVNQQFAQAWDHAIKDVQTTNKAEILRFSG